MKNKFFTLLALSALLVGCADAYEVDQPGLVTEEGAVFSNANDISRGIQGLYSSLPGESEIEFDSFFTDETAPGKDNSGQGVNDGSWTFILQSGNDFANSIWSSYYNVVNRTNRMLNRIDELSATATGAELASLKENKAKLHVLRAYCHYKLFAFFTPDYSDPSGLSVIKFDFLQTDDYSRFEKRATVAEIVAFIESDIELARELGVVNNNDYSAYVNVSMLDAILVKMYSMVGTSQAYAKLEEAFNRLNTGDYARSLATYDTYTLLYGGDASGTASGEAIFRLKRTSTDGSTTSGVASAWYPATVDVDDIYYMEMGRSLYNELDKLDPSKQGQIRVNNDRLDVRYNVSVFSDSKVEVNYSNLSQDEYKAKDLLLIGKYTGIENRQLMADIWIFRFTDMLLALAEKRAFEGLNTGNVEIGDYSNVESIIYNIRAHRNFSGEIEPASMPTNFSSTQEAYARILEERRVEFAFEGVRYLDMKRLGVKAGSPGFVRDAKDCASTGACQLAPNTTKLTLPIPRSEMLANPNMIQNTGY